MNRSIILVMFVAVIGLGMLAGFAGLIDKLNAQSQAMTYQTIDGDCKIRVYDDPLYAEHWAKEVNPYNCQAYKTQEEANYIKANSRKINVETTEGITGVYSIFGVVAGVLILLTLAIIKGNK